MVHFMGIRTYSLIAILCFVSGTVNARTHSEDVTFTSGDAVFSGTLTLPEGPGPHPAVVMISGMGQQDRDWSFVGGKYKLARGMADHLTAKGIAVLRTDDRGHGQSTGTPEMETGFDGLADDIHAAVTLLRKRSDIAEIGLCGHSLGGITAPYMQTKYNAVDFMIIVSGSFITGEHIALDQARTGEGLDIVKDTLYRLINWQIDNLTEAQIQENLQYYKDVDEFRNKSYEGAVRYYTSPHQLSFVSHDPAKYISKVTCPILVLFGDKDKHVTLEKNRAPLMHAMADAATKDFTVKVIADADHVYTTFPLNQTWEVLPEMLNFMTHWIQARVGHAGPDEGRTTNESVAPAE